MCLADPRLLTSYSTRQLKLRLSPTSSLLSQWIRKEKLVWPRVLGDGLHSAPASLSASLLSFPLGSVGQVQNEAQVQVCVHLGVFSSFPKWLTRARNLGSG